MTRETLEYIVPFLVDHPDEIEVTELHDEQSGDLVLEVSVHPEDTGKVIGRNGRIIRALRTVSKAAGQRSGRQVNVEVVD